MYDNLMAEKDGKLSFTQFRERHEQSALFTKKLLQ